MADIQVRVCDLCGRRIDSDKHSDVRLEMRIERVREGPEIGNLGFTLKDGHACHTCAERIRELIRMARGIGKESRWKSAKPGYEGVGEPYG